MGKGPDFSNYNVFFSKDAKIEVNINNGGVSVVANAEGYLALARFFCLLSEIHMSIRKDNNDPGVDTIYGYGAYHFTHYLSTSAIKHGNFLFSPGPLKSFKSNGNIQDVLFWVSDKIGPDFWLTETESGASEEWIDYSLEMAIDDSSDDIDED